MVYISAKGIEALRNYKYTSGISGFLDRVVFTPFWEAVVKLLPTWLAPNVITTLSLLHAVAVYLIILYYHPRLSGTAPRLVYAFCAYCIFMYQTLDAIDGKQARRTGSSSPLGQLFDHGCDALAASLMGIFVAATVSSGSSFTSLFILYLHIIPFFISNWEAAQTHVMRFGIIGVTEGELILVAIFLFTSIFGPEMWLLEIYNGILICHLPMILGLLGTPYLVIESWLYVNNYWKTNQVDRMEGLGQFVQFTIFIAMISWWVFFIYNSLYQENAQLVLMTIAIIFTYLTSRLIVCDVTHDPYPRFHPILYPFPLVLANSAAAYFYGQAIFDQYTMACAYLLLCIVFYLHFIINVIREICTALHINCFTIKAKN